MSIIDNMSKHNLNLSNYATKDEDSIRLKPYNPDIRPNFFRDIDRIIYSLSYTRYIDKTQVFSNNDNDNISKRMTHVQMVSKIARTISRGLSLNEDLTEAIALAHDLGHVPFGHVGEHILSDITSKYTGRMFNHNVHSARILKDVENNGNGYNISIQVLDGALCHNGEFVSNEYKPRIKTKEEFLREYEECYYNKETLKHLRPMTLEGCVVRISDVIGYIGRDIEDAIRLGVINIEDVPNNIKEVLGTTNGQIINTVIMDILNNSLDKPYIKLSEDIYKAIVDLKAFNYENIYNKANTKEQIDFYKEVFNSLFIECLKQVNNNETDKDIYKVYLDYMCEDYINNTSNEDKVIDYIAGMTDDYIVSQYNKYVKKAKN